MGEGLSVLRLFLLAERRADPAWALVLLDRLAAHRTVVGEPPEWQVIYETDDVSEAMCRCAADLDRLDPRWLETLDFDAVKPRRRRVEV